MTIIHLDNISYSYSGIPILLNINWKLNQGETIGLIGRNGCGKTTLLHLINGTLKPESGNIHKIKNKRIAMLDQEQIVDDQRSIEEYVLEAFDYILELKDNISELEESISISSSKNETIQSDLIKLSELRDRFEYYGGYTYKTKMKELLNGLGFPNKELTKSVSLLSGGERRRLGLAVTLLRTPDILLLDEPTNHLDIKGLETLELYLREFKGVSVIITHDRYFLKKCNAKITTLSNLTLEHYSGNYDKYLVERESRLKHHQKVYEKQQSDIARQEELIRRTIAGQKTKIAQSRLKVVDKMKSIALKQLFIDNSNAKVAFDTFSRGVKRVIEIKNGEKGFDNICFFNNLNLTVYRGDKIGIIGPNGCGKTTLIKCLLDFDNLDSGELEKPDPTSTGYYDQTLSGLNDNNSIIDELRNFLPAETENHLRSLAGRFLFTKDEVFKKIKNLSGGERARLLLAKLSSNPKNLLIMDEPTNHLDIETIEVLEKALLEFEGTLIIVSHDRYFLDKVINKLLVFENKKTDIHIGNYTDYNYSLIQKQNEENNAQISLGITQISESKIERKAQFIEEKNKKRSIEKIKRRIIAVEENITNNESLLEQLSLNLSDPDLASNWNELTKKQKEKERIEKETDNLLSEWEELQEEI